MVPSRALLLVHFIKSCFTSKKEYNSLPRNAKLSPVDAKPHTTPIDSNQNAHDVGDTAEYELIDGY
ncbi:hypothetical protein DPMN_048817 [Dreissena polymorpha]|uniref:Uncharacterized protein n=1 Tax=Dreissena polymorpha TaxID=45954 RepID=A0A9D4DE28_DREPO|nr:hypothetical protein DPMN_048817 [Dreissena polymorpha]